MQHAVRDGGLDLLRLHELDPQRYPFLIESVAAHPRSARWDILFADPDTALIGRDGVLEGPGCRAPDDDFFAALDRWFTGERITEASTALPYLGGWFLLLGYEAARWVEPSLKLPASPHRLPDALAVRCRGAVLRDRLHDRIHVLAEKGDAQLASLLADIDRLSPAPDGTPPPLRGDLQEEIPARFEAGVRRILDWLAAGDTFQANLSRRWDMTLETALDSATIYRRLRDNNPSPFAGLAVWNDVAVISSSPERLLQIDADGCAQSRPIAGTRPRGTSADHDVAQREQLIENLKERAEHVMLIDLERNDLGRVCVPGSVTVDEIMTLETYAHVHHIVSNVKGRLREGVGPGAALRAVFPGGTITGCPKVRAMEIIAELEGEGRGPYTGGIGYLSLDGRLDVNILIRTLVHDGRHISLRAGAGIVADSEPSRELAETRAKARGLLLALGVTPEH